ncbi:MAG: hypothetical protein LBN00_08925 [Oscillospiraceae bacterium]|jgi:ABC-type glycerol-3-phosphate transport system substrate-binding protein|nr:hypothetical protein [Oscillospiraceae bacterium]
MIKVKFTRAIALTLGLAAVLSTVGCKPKVVEEPAKEKPTHVWRETALPVPDTLENAYNIKLAGDKVYFPGNEWNSDTQGYTSTVSYYSITTGEVTKLLTLTGASKTEAKDNVYSYNSYESILPLADGTFWLVETNNYEDYSDPENYISEQNTYIKHFAADATELTSIDTKTLLPEEQYIWVNGLEADAAGNIYAVCSNSLVVFDGATGAVLFKLSQENGSVSQLMRFGDGTIAATVWDNTDGTNPIRRVNTAAKAWGDSITTPPNTYFDSVIPGDGDFLFYYLKYNVGVFGLKADGAAEEVINFLNSDLDSNNINGLQHLENGDFLMFWYEYDDTPSGNALRISLLSKVPDGEIKEAIILKYACLWLDYDVKRKILKFNKANEDYRIVIDDYSVYQTDADYEAGYKRLATDIISGKIPDIINLDNINAQSFINKGLLADLYELIDASPNVSREDYVQSVLEASEVDGKLYRFMPNFNIYSVAAKRKIVGDTPGWTMDDLNALMEKYPDAQSFFPMTKAEILNYSLMLGLSQYVDWDTGTVNFGENFIKLLEYADTFPKEIDYEKIYGENYDYQKIQDMYKNDETLLSSSYVSGYRSIRDVEDYTFYDEITYIGFPTEDRMGSVFMPNNQFAISGKSSKEVQQICFEFLSTLVETEPDFKNSGGYFYGNFSINKNYNDKVREFELTPLTQREGYVNQEGSGGIGGGPAPLPRLAVSDRYRPGAPDETQEEYQAHYALSQYEIDAVDHLINNTTKFYVTDTEMNIIITEETDAYFAGQKSAEETAKLIQSRVQLYVSESR